MKVLRVILIIAITLCIATLIKINFIDETVDTTMQPFFWVVFAGLTSSQIIVVFWNKLFSERLY